MAATDERRRAIRSSTNLQVSLRPLPPGQLPEEVPEVQGQIVNATDSGLCVVTQAPLAPLSSVHIRVRLSEGGANFPSLAQVRWSRRVSQGHVSGLQFII